MRNDKLNFGVILRVMVSLIPLFLGLPTLGIIFCAYNLAMSYIVFGPLTAFVSSLCALCVSMLFAGSFGVAGELTGFVIGIQAVLCAAGCVYGYGHKRRFYFGLCLATVGVLLPQLLYTRYQAFSVGVSIAELLVPQADVVKMMMGEALNQLGSAGVEGSVIETVIDTVREITTMLIPSALIISSAMIAYGSMWSVAAQLRRFPAFGAVHSFSHIRLPKMMVAFCALFVCLNIFGAMYSYDVITLVAANMLMILLSLALFSGMSLADFYLRKFIKVTFLRLILHGIIFLNLSPVYILAAFADTFFNFRKLRNDSPERGEADAAEK